MVAAVADNIKTELTLLLQARNFLGGNMSGQEKELRLEGIVRASRRDPSAQLWIVR
jgi:hypothetical protein